MGLISSLLEGRSKLSNPDRWFIRLLGGEQSASGIAVDQDTALESTAWLAAVRVLAETIAALPIFVYRRLPGGGKEAAQDHPLHRILHDTPNPEMTAPEWKDAMQGHLAGWGNGYSEIVRNRGGQVMELWPLRPDRVTPKRHPTTRKLLYDIRLPSSVGGGTVTLAESRILHLRGLSSDGITGYSLVELAREAIGLSLAAERFGGKFFGQGTQLGGVLEHPNTISEPAYKRMQESWEESHSGLEKAWRVAILEEGVQWKQTGIPPKDSQFLETRKFQVEEVSRITRIPPHMLGSLDKATFSNIEHQGLEFVVYTMAIWFTLWEKRLMLSLLTPREREQYFIEFLVDALLRGDIKARYEAYAIGRNWGWLSANDVRGKENLNPVAGGDTYLTPLNMIPATAAGSMTADDVRALRMVLARNQPELLEGGRQPQVRLLPAPIEHRDFLSERRRLRRAFRPILTDGMGRVTRREVNTIREAGRRHLASRDAQSFLAWVRQFYEEEYPEILKRNMLPALSTYANAIVDVAADEVAGSRPDDVAFQRFISDYGDAFEQRRTATNRGQLRAVIDQATSAGEDPQAALELRLDEWEERTPDRVGRWESVQMGSATTKLAFVAAGIIALRWRAFGDSCPYCEALDGRVADIVGSFLDSGVEFQPEGADRPLTPSVSVGHPPAHDGCDCDIVAG